MTTKEFFGTSSIFLITMLVLSIPTIILVSSTQDTFSAGATITNSPPTISVDAGQSVTGQTAGSKVVYLTFNASDANGWGDLNDTTAKIIINRTGETTRTSTSCAVLAGHINSQTSTYNCSISIWFFDGSGAWTMNASVTDNSTNFVQNTSASATLNTVDSVAVVSSSISFSGAPGTTNASASPLQQLNNTGNVNYASINITGFAFTSGSNVIGVGNVTVNTTNGVGFGQNLINNTKVTIASSALAKGNNSKTSMYFWLNIPAGAASGSYTSQSNWILDAN